MISKKQPPNPDFLLLKRLAEKGFKKIVGVDEVGRGSLVGPLVVAAVELDLFLENITDSKLIPKTQHGKLADSIRYNAQQISIGSVSNSEIDKIGLKKSLVLAYLRALEHIEYDLVLTDAIKLPLNSPQIKSIKGDRIFYCCAAASIVAKAIRDNLMRSYSYIFPVYNWNLNSGYATQYHLNAINKYGTVPLHRQSFLGKINQKRGR